MGRKSSPATLCGSLSESDFFLFLSRPQRTSPRESTKKLELETREEFALQRTVFRLRPSEIGATVAWTGRVRVRRPRKSTKVSRGEKVLKLATDWHHCDSSRVRINKQQLIARWRGRYSNSEPATDSIFKFRTHRSNSSEASRRTSEREDGTKVTTTLCQQSASIQVCLCQPDRQTDNGDDS